MLTPAATLLVASLGLAQAAALPQATDTDSCTADRRIAISSQIPYAYSQPGVTATYNAFHDIPFGVPDLRGPCVTEIWPNGGGPIPVGIDGNGVVNFGTESRQIFSSVTGQYQDFGDNGTTVIYTNVTLGVSSIVPIPVTFSGQVYLDFNNDCRISAVRAYAEVPTYIDGQPVDIYKLLPIPQLPEPA